ncbi:hypothetical protein AB0M41_25895 [Streptomyces sp. NPDC051896]|uniref:hypothetical protein n=1 Tax=Streptomyces sp. NPDC051896 TaxID=3155416 RepID=UPI00344704AB
MTQIRRLRLEDLDRARGQLRVRRPDRLDHVACLDELALDLVTTWITERVERWPDSTNPYLMVGRQTAVDDLHPQVSQDVISTPSQRAGIRPDKLRQDRLFDEAGKPPPLSVSCASSASAARPRRDRSPLPPRQEGRPGPIRA